MTLTGVSTQNPRTPTLVITNREAVIAVQTTDHPYTTTFSFSTPADLICFTRS